MASAVSPVYSVIDGEQWTFVGYNAEGCSVYKNPRTGQTKVFT